MQTFTDHSCSPIICIGNLFLHLVFIELLKGNASTHNYAIVYFVHWF